MAIYIRRFRKGDMDAIDANETGMDFSEEIKDMIEHSGLAVTGVRNGKVVGCGGVHPDGEHGTLWLRVSKDCRRFGIEAARCIKKVLGIFESEFKFRQLNAYVRCNFPASINMMKKLGYTQTRSGEWNVYSKRVQ